MNNVEVLAPKNMILLENNFGKEKIADGQTFAIKTPHKNQKLELHSDAGLIKTIVLILAEFS
jgi:hypothetical protein